MMPVHRHVVRDEVALGNEMVMLNESVPTEVVCDYRNDLLPTLSTLWTGGVVDHVFCDQLVDRGLVTCRQTTKKLPNHILRLGCHERIMSAAQFRVERRWMGTWPFRSAE
jgi:hypothetical protein